MIILNCLAGHGHGNLIKGTVTANDTGELLSGATVMLNSDVTTKTDALGNFRFDNLADGSYTLRITHIGYIPYSLETVVSNDEVRSLRINLLNEEWNEAQFDTETRLPGETSGISELTFTPGDPLFIKAGITFFF